MTPILKQSTLDTSHRIVLLDLWRGLAVLGMIFFHILYLGNRQGVFSVNVYEGFFAIFGDAIRISFLLLVGVSLSLSYLNSGHFFAFLRKQFKRIFILLSCSTLVTVVTWIVIPNEFVVFGILHLITSSVFILLFLTPFPHFSGLLGLVILFFTSSISALQTDAWWGILLGLQVKEFVSVDWFPLLPWFGYVALGVLIGSWGVLFPRTEPGQISGISALLSFLGQHALLIYMAHFPILFGITWVISRY